MYAGCAGETVRSIENTCYTVAERLSGVIMTRHYTNQRLPYLTFSCKIIEEGNQKYPGNKSGAVNLEQGMWTSSATAGRR